MGRIYAATAPILAVTGVLGTLLALAVWRLRAFRSPVFALAAASATGDRLPLGADLVSRRDLHPVRRRAIPVRRRGRS